MIWLAIAAMTAAAVLAVLWPLARRGKDLRAGSDVAVYRDQLEEIDRDQAVGAIAPLEADAARLEVSRRLLAADAAATAAGRATPAPDGASRRRRSVAVGALVALPVGALAVYLALGSPDLPGQPLASRVAQAHGGGGSGGQTVAEMFGRVERHLEEHPDDGRGWEVVAPIYLRLGRYDDAVKARRNALQYLGETAERQADLGEALMLKGNGIVTDEAKAAFDRALVVDPKNITARFYSGVTAEQDGRKDDAARTWRALLADAPAGASWAESVQRALARVDGAAPAGPAPQAPTQAPPQAGPQADMIRAMVERLGARMREDGTNVEGWLQLIRSYTVLRDAARAEAAVADARKALAGDAQKLARLDEGLRAIAAGVPPSATVTAPSPAPPAVATAPQATPPAIPPAAAGSDEAQDAMIRGMVARLAAKLHEDGSDVDGWLRLMRSYVVLGEADKARAAVDDARRALKDDADKLRRLDEGAKSLGVGG
jgi:cytochrome c-type biogenesis protein CcmH